MNRRPSCRREFDTTSVGTRQPLTVAVPSNYPQTRGVGRVVTRRVAMATTLVVLAADFERILELSRL